MLDTLTKRSSVAHVVCDAFRGVFLKRIRDLSLTPRFVLAAITIYVSRVEMMTHPIRAQRYVSDVKIAFTSNGCCAIW